MVVVETAGGVTTPVRFPLILTSLDSKNQTPFYLNRRNRVNTIMTFVKVLLNGEVSARTPKRAREAACAP